MGTDNVPTLRQLQESVVGGGDGAQTQFQMQRLGDNLDKWTGLMKNAIMVGGDNGEARDVWYLLIRPKPIARLI